MGQTPGDDKKGPSLELPDLSLPGFGRRKRGRRSADADDAHTPADGYVEQDPSADEATTPLPAVDDATAAPEPTGAPEAAGAREPAEAPDAEAVPEPPRRRSRPARAPRSAPAVPGRVAAAVTGLIVGAAGGAGTYGALAGCEAVRGVSTCGGTPGFFILVAILAVMVLLGALLLKAFKVEAAGSTSFLGVGLVTVVSMMALLDVMDSPAMFVVIPLLSSVAYLLAHWVTTRFDEEPTDIRR